MIRNLKQLLTFLLLALPLALSAQTPRTSAEVLIRKDNLTPVAFTGLRLLFAESPYNQISPSVTDVDLWVTSQMEIDGHKSMIYTFRVDCGSSEYALIGVGGFYGSFWQGEPVVHDYTKRTLLWQPLKNACPVLQNVCSEDVSKKLLFFGPGASSLCP